MRIRSTGVVIACGVFALAVCGREPANAVQQVPRSVETKLQIRITQLHKVHSSARGERGLVGSRLVPEISADHLVPAAAGVRAQAVGHDGSMVDDFFLSRNGHILNVCNAPSPAATAALNIGKIIGEDLVN